MRLPPLALACAFLGLLAAPACHEASQEQKPLVAVRVHQLDPAGTAADTRYSANVEPFAKVDLAFRVGGYVRELSQSKGIDGQARPLQEGDTVTRGQVLARVREGDYLQRVAGAKAQVAEATAVREQARLDVERATKLVETQSIARSQLDDAKARIDAANARVEAAQALLTEAENAVADTALTSPIDGIVLKRAIEVGTLVGPGSFALAVADTRQVKVVFGVADALVDKLVVGSGIAITTQATPGVEYQGRITRVSPSADPKSRVFEVEATIPNPKQELRVGMVATLKVPESGQADGGQTAPVAATPGASGVLPLNAIVRSPHDPAGFAVYVVTEQGGHTTAHVRDVTLGDPVGNRILVTGGLARGDRVIVMGASLVAEGQDVQVIP